MSYEAGRQDESVFITAWSSVDQTMPSYDSSVDHNVDHTFNLDTQGEGDWVDLTNDVLTLPEGLSAFWIGDVRTETGSGTSDANLYSITFPSNTGEENGAPQDQRRSMADDLCYSIHSTAELKMWKNEKSSGDALALYVRTLGMVLGHS